MLLLYSLKVNVEPALFAVDDVNKKYALLIAVVPVQPAQRLSGHAYCMSIGSKSRLEFGRSSLGREDIVE